MTHSPPPKSCGKRIPACGQPQRGAVRGRERSAGAAGAGAARPQRRLSALHPRSPLPPDSAPSPPRSLSRRIPASSAPLTPGSVRCGAARPRSARAESGAPAPLPVRPFPAPPCAPGTAPPRSPRSAARRLPRPGPALPTGAATERRGGPGSRPCASPAGHLYIGPPHTGHSSGPPQHGGRPRVPPPPGCPNPTAPLPYTHPRSQGLLRAPNSSPPPPRSGPPSPPSLPPPTG